MIIWILKDNPAEKFYIGLEGKPTETKLFEVWGETFTEIEYV